MVQTEHALTHCISKKEPAQEFFRRHVRFSAGLRLGPRFRILWLWSQAPCRLRLPVFMPPRSVARVRERFRRLASECTKQLSPGLIVNTLRSSHMLQAFMTRISTSSANRILKATLRCVKTCFHALATEASRTVEEMVATIVGKRMMPVCLNECYVLRSFLVE